MTLRSPAETRQYAVVHHMTISQVAPIMGDIRDFFPYGKDA